MPPDALEHDPEKWSPVFGKDHGQNRRQTMAAMTANEIIAIEERFPEVFHRPAYKRFWPLFLVAGTVLYLAYALWFFTACRRC
jgi:hypothetical protein